jgi:hypothetical protein
MQVVEESSTAPDHGGSLTFLLGTAIERYQRQDNYIL